MKIEPLFLLTKASWRAASDRWDPVEMGVVGVEDLGAGVFHGSDGQGIPEVYVGAGVQFQSAQEGTAVRRRL